MTSILKVSEIQDPTNNNSALTIDSSGRVAMPLKPAFSAVRTNTQAVNNATIICPTVITNVGGHYNGTTGQFTCPIAGLYQFNFQCIGVANTSAFDIFAKINGTTSQHLLAVRPSSVNQSDPYSSHSSATGVAVFAASDTVEVFTPQNLTIYSDGNSWLKFSGYFIG